MARLEMVRPKMNENINGKGARRTSLSNLFKVKDKVKIIETNTSIFYIIMNKSTVMHNLNAIA